MGHGLCVHKWRRDYIWIHGRRSTTSPSKNHGTTPSESDDDIRADRIVHYHGKQRIPFYALHDMRMTT